LSQSVLNVTQARINVCIRVPPIIPLQIPCNIMLYSNPVLHIDTMKLQKKKGVLILY
jgi:hypothetical protein